MSDSTNQERPAAAPPPRRHSRLALLLKSILLAVVVAVVAVGLLLLYWGLRPNASRVDVALGIEDWPAVADGMHNSNTDLTFWRDRFYLIQASSPWHFASERCKLVLWRSPDARTWERVREFNVPGQDVRDPKFAVIHDRLFLYALKNTSFDAEPYTTCYASSEDGEAWTPFEDMRPEGWLFWRPKTRDGATWYVPAYWHEHGKSILLESTDGTAWTEVSTIYEGDRNDETALEFFPDGRMLATARLEVSDSYFGDPGACTLIAVAAPPYTEWQRKKSRVTRLDGPCLFVYEGAVYAVGRGNPDSPRFLDYYGSLLGRKRTALYRVEPDRLVYLSDLPSAGDTSYAGVVLRDNAAYISYYTSPIDRDYPWLLGMLSPSEIRIARVPLAFLPAL